MRAGEHSLGKFRRDAGRRQKPLRAQRRTTAAQDSATKAPKARLRQRSARAGDSAYNVSISSRAKKVSDWLAELAQRQDPSGKAFLNPEQLDFVRTVAARVIEEEKTGEAENGGLYTEARARESRMY